MSVRGTTIVALWLLTTTIAVYASPVGDCPPVDPIDHTDHLPDDKNCSLFYKCDHAAPVLFYCPDGLHFNKNLEVCDWPDKAGCAGGSGSSSTAPSSPAKPTTAVPTSPSDPSTAAPPSSGNPSTGPTSSTAGPSSSENPSSANPSSPASSDPNGDCPAVGACPRYEDENSIAKHLPHATNCSQFCKCDHGKPVTFDCPAGLHFNAELEVCDWPENVDCTGGSGSSSSAPSSTAKPTTAAPTSPSKPSTAAPPSSEIPSIAASSSTAAPSSSPNPTSANPSSPASSDPNGDCPAIGACPHYEDETSIAKHLPHATNCSQFCKCDHGKPVTFDCPSGLHFNAELEVCDWPENVDCTGGSGSSSSAPSSTAKPTTAASTSPSKPTTAAPPSSGNPSTAASSSTAAPSSSPNPTSANPSSPASSDPNGDCPAIGACPRYEDENSIAKHLPHATNCSQFCKCDHGKPVTFNCSAGLHFNAELEVCDWPENAGCTGGSGSSSSAPSSTAKPTTAAPTSPSKPSTAAPPSSENPSTAASSSTALPSSSENPTSANPSSPASSDPNGDCPAIGACPRYEDENSIAKHLPHATNCSQFCKCDHGKPVTFDCPAGLHFNAELEVCDWPENAGCTGGSVSSSSTPSSTAKPSSSVPTSPSKPSTAAPTSPAATSSTASPSAPNTTSSVPHTTIVPPSSSTSQEPGGVEPCDAVGSCPVYDQNSIVKHLPHRTNCGLYCRCNHGIPITEKCPDGLHFNAKKEVCDWPADAGCA